MPHSEIHGSKGARPSPRLFAACHVLHRLSVPRHPPNALRRLISAADKTAHARPRALTQGHRGGLSRSNHRRNNSAIGDQASRIRRPSTPTPRPNRSGHLPLHNVQYPYGHATGTTAISCVLPGSLPSRRSPPRTSLLGSPGACSARARQALRDGHRQTLHRTVCRWPWWRRTESNRRPQACKASALPTELRPRSRSQGSEVRSQISDSRSVTPPRQTLV